MENTHPAIAASERRRLNLNRILSYAVIYIVLIFFAFVFLYPLYNMILGSFMDDNELFSRTPVIWPRSFDLEAYERLFTYDAFNYFRAWFNTFFLAFVQVIGVLFFASLAGYTFAKRHFPGRNLLFTIMLLTLFMPTQATLIPWYLLMVQQLKWGNTFWPFWVPAWAGAFGIFWMRQYIKSTIPDELIDAAAIDGCSSFATFWRVVLPNITPGLTVLGILTFITAFNDFLGPLLILSSPDMMTVQLVLANFRGSTIAAPRYSLLFAGATLATVPLIIIFFVFQRQLVAGIMSGAVKG